MWRLIVILNLLDMSFYLLWYVFRSVQIPCFSCRMRDPILECTIQPRRKIDGKHGIGNIMFLDTFRVRGIRISLD